MDKPEVNPTVIRKGMADAPRPSPWRSATATVGDRSVTEPVPPPWPVRVAIWGGCLTAIASVAVVALCGVAAVVKATATFVLN